MHAHSHASSFPHRLLLLPPLALPPPPASTICQNVAVKVEPLKTRYPQLYYEAKLYKILAGGVGIPLMKSVPPPKETKTKKQRRGEAEGGGGVWCCALLASVTRISWLRSSAAACMLVLWGLPCKGGMDRRANSMSW